MASRATEVTGRWGANPESCGIQGTQAFYPILWAMACFSVRVEGGPRGQTFLLLRPPSMPPEKQAAVHETSCEEDIKGPLHPSGSGGETSAAFSENSECVRKAARKCSELVLLRAVVKRGVHWGTPFCLSCPRCLGVICKGRAGGKGSLMVVEPAICTVWGRWDSSHVFGVCPLREE